MKILVVLVALAVASVIGSCLYASYRDDQDRKDRQELYQIWEEYEREGEEIDRLREAEPQGEAFKAKEKEMQVLSQREYDIIGRHPEWGHDQSTIRPLSPRYLKQQPSAKSTPPTKNP
jgi:hypothetical protein